MRKSEWTFFEPQRQSVSAIVIFIYNFIVRMLRGFWPVLLVLFFRSGQKQDTYEILLNSLLLVGAGFSLVISVVSYFRYFYHLENDRLIIQKGVINHTRVNLPFDRIQNIQIEQKVLHRLLQVVSLRIDTAGSQGSEITIEALERDQAVAIRSYVLSQKMDSERKEEGKPDDQIADLPRSTVLSLSLMDLIRVGISQNHLRMAGIIVGTVFGFVFTLADSLGDSVWKDGYEKVQELNLAYWIYFLLAAALILVAFVLTVLRTIARYYGLVFSEDREGFQLTAGLFNRRETALKKEKIQIIRWANNPIRKLLGFYLLTIRQANAGGIQHANLMTIPGCGMGQVEDVVMSSFSKMAEVAYDSFRMEGAFVGWYFRFVGILPLVGFGSLAFFSQSWQFLVPALGIPILAFVLLRAYRKNYQLLIDQRYVKTVGGVLGRTHTLLPMYKVQAVDLQQSYYQRKRQLATLILYTAGGAVVIPFITLPLASDLRDYVLYQVEASQQTWM